MDLQRIRHSKGECAIKRHSVAYGKVGICLPYNKWETFYKFLQGDMQTNRFSMLKPSKRLSNRGLFKHRHNELFYLKCCCPGASIASSEADPWISWENVGTSCIRRYYTCLHQFFMHYRGRKWDMQPLLLAFGLRKKKSLFCLPS